MAFFQMNNLTQIIKAKQLLYQHLESIRINFFFSFKENYNLNYHHYYEQMQLIYNLLAILIFQVFLILKLFYSLSKFSYYLEKEVTSYITLLLCMLMQKYQLVNYMIPSEEVIQALDTILLKHILLMVVENEFILLIQNHIF